MDETVMPAPTPARGAGHPAAPHTAPEVDPRPDDPVVIVIMGVSGAGKSTVGRLLADQLLWEFAEGDDFHPSTNVTKMRSGLPLTDQDRAPWLNTLRTWIENHVAQNMPGVLTCSALKAAYRRTMHHDRVCFVHLVAEPELARARVAARAGHFMPDTLVRSQFDDLEPLQPSRNALIIDATLPPAAIVGHVVAHIASPSHTRPLADAMRVDG